MAISESEKQEILEKAKQFFVQRLIRNHVSNTKKLLHIQEFNFNPFTVPYLAQFAFGDLTPKSLAKILVYPRALGTSIATSFGTQIQKFSTEVLAAYASTTSGMDVEYIDERDGRRKYCQMKAGPQTINHDDVKTIDSHFRSLRNLARTNGLDINPDKDCVVGVIYGTEGQLATHYKDLRNLGYTVLVGDEFWTALTGDDAFYEDLISAVADVDVSEAQGVLSATIDNLTKYLKEHPKAMPLPSESIVEHVTATHL